MHKYAKEKWVLKDGCIWTEAEHEVQLSKYVRVRARHMVIPNVGSGGESLGPYLVKLHNEKLERNNVPS